MLRTVTMANLNRRQFLAQAGAVAAGITLAGCQKQFAAMGGKPATKPNIIFILADDLGYGDLGCYGQQKILTPSLDRMAVEGMRFTQHYSGSPVCASSRCSLMTGLHCGHALFRDNGPVNLRPEDFTVAEMLKGAGYTTACIGKWGLGEDGSTGVPNRKGFDYFFGFLNQVHAHNHWPDYLWRNDTKVKLANEVTVEIEWGKFYKQTATKKAHYSEDIFTEEAIRFITQNSGKPFFLYLAYTVPHASLEVPADSLEQYAGKFAERPFAGKHYAHQAMPRAAFAGMISRMDRDIGRILDLLKVSGLDEDTIVFFSSDNGAHKEGGADPEFFNSTGGLRGIKRDLYEGGIRVPLIVRGPGRIKGGSVSNNVSAFWDFFPTCAELAGVGGRENIDGISIVPTLCGREGRQRRHKYLYWEFPTYSSQALRMGDWKAVRFGTKGKPELYNLAQDVAEKNDVAEQNRRVVAEMERLLAEARSPSEHFKLAEEAAKTLAMGTLPATW